jgi:hypothetical protein
MKKLSIFLILLIGILSSNAQDNKPDPGAFGIGYGANFMPFSQGVNFTYVATSHIEFGGTVWLVFTRTRSSTFDSLTVIGTGFTTLPAQHEHRTVTTVTTVGITPLVKYHFKTKNNLDVYTGANLPIGIGTGTKTVVSDITTADNFNSTASTTTTGPVTVSIGAGVLLGCQYFFYQHLCFGLETNLGFIASIANGKNKTVDAISNSGSNNPATGTTVNPVTTTSMVKSDSETLSMLHSIGISLSWYFGGNKESK